MLQQEKPSPVASAGLITRRVGMSGMDESDEEETTAKQDNGEMQPADNEGAQDAARDVKILENQDGADTHSSS